ncbi:TetR/AcrR family transcriptional regulator [Streptomyces sp. NPDC051840]|uniref:TetR/AcrR family transcriptional regulator n=1 Tax=unclassified Streptomyces TaxID=2593676 RepID=UPI003440AB95
MPTRPTGYQAIVEAAREEIAERGYGAASIRDIAQRAGVSLSALYYYYKSKQELLVAILDEAHEAFFTACGEALERAGDDPAEQLEALVTATIRYRTSHRVKSSIMETEQRSLEPAHLERYRKNAEQGTQQFRAVIERGVAEGIFLTPYPDDSRRAVIAMCNAVAQWYRPGGEITVDDLIERYVSLALTVVEYRPRAPRRAVRG